jgi:LysM repeat protein
MTGRPSGPMRQRPRRSPIVLIAAIVGLVGLLVGLNSQVVETLLPGTLASVARASSQAVQDASIQPLIELASEPSAVDAVLARMPEQQTQASAGATTSSSSSAPCHLVQRGDTLFALARRFGTTVEAIKAANSLCSSRILVGQKLQIPVSTAPCRPVSAVCPTVCPPVSAPVCAPTRVVVSQPVCPPTRVVVSRPVCPAPQVVVSVPVCVPVVCQPVVCVPVVCVPVCQPVVCAPVCPPFVDP